MTSPTTYRIADKAPVFPCWVFDSRKWIYERERIFPTDTHWCSGIPIDRPTHDPTEPASPDSPPAWAVEAAKDCWKFGTNRAVIDTEIEKIARIIAKHAPASPASSAAKGGDIPRTPTDSEMMDELETLYSNCRDARWNEFMLAVAERGFRAAIATAMMKKA